MPETGGKYRDESLLKEIFETRSEAIFIVRVRDDGTYFYEKFSRVYETFLQERLEDIEDRTPDELLDKESAETVKENYRKCFEKGEALFFEERVPLKSGVQYWETILNPVYREGKPFRIIGFARPIDKRRELEAEIKKSIDRLETLIRISQYRTSSNQEFLDYALEQAIRLTESKIGYIYFYDEEKKEFTLNTWSKDVMKECTIKNPQTVYQLDKTGIWGEAVRQRRPIILNDFQASHPLKKGYPEGHAMLLKFLTLPVMIDDEVKAVVGVANKESDYDNNDVMQLTLLMDAVWKISEIRKAQDDLIRTKENLLEVQRLSKISRWELDFTSGNFSYSDEIMEIFGTKDLGGNVTLDELTPYLNETDMKKFFEGFESLAKEGTSLNLEVRFLVQKKEFKNLLIIGKCDTFENGMCIKASGSVQDITGIRNMEEKNRILQEQLFQSQKLEALGQLAGGVAHDFNNMLAGIMGNAEILQMKLMDDPENLETVKKIVVSSEHAANLTQQLLSFSRKGKYQTVPVEINRTILDAISILEKTVDKRIQIEKSLDSKNPIILGDPAQIENAVLNLGLNSRDAMPEGGMLSFAAIVNADATNVEITVEDNGVGIPRDMKRHLFEPFYTTKAKGKGTGLGLAGVYGVVKNHGGTIKVDSEEGRGTKITIQLPLFEGKSEENNQADGTPSKLGFGNILLIDDERTIRDSTATILKENGFNVFDFGDCDEAIEFYRREHKIVNVVVLDMIMPKKNGREVFFELKKIDRNVRVIVSTGFSKDGEASELLTYPNVSFLQKPYRSSALIEQIKNSME